MDIAQPLPRRKAAIKATTQLADISSDEESDTRHGSDDYVAPQRVEGIKSRKDGKGAKGRGKRRLVADSMDPDATIGVAGAKKRKRRVSTLASLPRKRQRQRGPEHNGSVCWTGDGVDDESDLTPLSSDDEQEENRPSGRPIADFLLQSPPLASRPNRKGTNGNRTDAPPLPEISDLDDDSDDLPDVGMVLSQQQDVLTPKGSNSRKYNGSTRKRHSNAKTKRLHDNSPCSVKSSPTLPPTLSPAFLPLSPQKSLVHDDAMTQSNLSDHFDLPSFSDDSDLELDSIGAGELCLAKAKATETVYWPAKVLQVQKSSSKGKGREKKMFRVMFLDKKEKDIPRDWFYTSSQEEFCTCSIGQFESSHVEVINDIDEESRRNNDHNARRRLSLSPSRSPSPIYIPSLPQSGPAYCDLSLRRQFAYVTPVLKAIMTEEYTWGLRRHELYVKGGTGRLKLLNEGGMRGAMDARSVDELLVFVEQWCLGCRGRDFVGDDDEEEAAANHQFWETIRDNGDKKEVQVASKSSDSTSEAAHQVASAQVSASSRELEQQNVALGGPTTEHPPPSETESQLDRESVERRSISPSPPPPPTQPQLQLDEPPPKCKPPRQRGSPAYEKLSPLDKVQYCIEVLLPEAISQILLWRTGERKSVEIMWDNVEEEKRLHERGEQLLRETDWVMDVMRLRRALERGRDKEGKSKAVTEDAAKGKGKDLRRTRSGRVGGVVGSYKE